MYALTNLHPIFIGRVRDVIITLFITQDDRPTKSWISLQQLLVVPVLQGNPLVVTLDTNGHADIQICHSFNNRWHRKALLYFQESIE